MTRVPTSAELSGIMPQDKNLDWDNIENVSSYVFQALNWSVWCNRDEIPHCCINIWSKLRHQWRKRTELRGDQSPANTLMSGAVAVWVMSCLGNWNLWPQSCSYNILETAVPILEKINVITLNGFSNCGPMRIETCQLQWIVVAIKPNKYTSVYWNEAFFVPESKTSKTTFAWRVAWLLIYVYSDRTLTAVTIS